MKLRVGRHNDRIVYIQIGEDPTDDDEMLAVFFEPIRAATTVTIMNEHFAGGSGGEDRT
jgi:hypothetical protein